MTCYRYDSILRKNHQASTMPETLCDDNILMANQTQEALDNELDSEDNLSDEADLLDLSIDSTVLRKMESLPRTPLSYHSSVAASPGSCPSPLEIDGRVALTSAVNARQQNHGGEIGPHSRDTIPLVALEFADSMLYDPLPMPCRESQIDDRNRSLTSNSAAQDGFGTTGGKQIYRSVLTLEGVHSETLRIIMDILSKTETKVKLETCQ